MRLAFSSLACPGWSVEEIAAAARNYGYEGVEWRLADGELLGLRTPADVWERIQACGVAAVCLDTSCVFVRATDDERERAVTDAVAMGERASAIGAPAIRTFGGPIPDGLSLDDVLGPTRDALATAAAGLPSGVHLLVETHDAWSTGAQVAELGVGVVWDVAHTVRAGESPEETLGQTGVPGLVHVKDAKGPQLVHLGEGTIPLGEAVRALRAIGYDGWLSLEWEKLWHPDLDDAAIVLPRAASYLRELVAQGSAT